MWDFKTTSVVVWLLCFEPTTIVVLKYLWLCLCYVSILFLFYLLSSLSKTISLKYFNCWHKTHFNIVTDYYYMFIYLVSYPRRLYSRRRGVRQSVASACALKGKHLELSATKSVDTVHVRASACTDLRSNSNPNPRVRLTFAMGMGRRGSACWQDYTFL